MRPVNGFGNGCLPAIAASDFWGAYQRILPSSTHQSVGKETGETAHMERWYTTLRQRLAPMFGKHSRVQRATNFIIFLRNGSSLSTIWRGAEYHSDEVDL